MLCVLHASSHLILKRTQKFEILHLLLFSMCLCELVFINALEFELRECLYLEQKRMLFVEF